MADKTQHDYAIHMLILERDALRRQVAEGEGRVEHFRRELANTEAQLARSVETLKSIERSLQRLSEDAS